jgi:hypothetical protein
MERPIGSLRLEGPYRPRHRPRPGRFRPVVIFFTSALLLFSAIGLTAALAHLL